MRFLAAALVLLWPASAGASMNKTLDISAHAGRMQTDDWDASGGSARLGQTFGPLRFGMGVAGFRPEVSERAHLVSTEWFWAYAPGGYHNVRPFIELRAHVDYLRLGDVATTRGAAGLRAGVLLPLSEYFFLDAGIGRDVIGPDTMRATIGLGLPIPISHL